MYKCKYCNREFERRHQLIGHIPWCKENPKYDENKKKKQLDDARSKKKLISINKTHKDNIEYVCKFCGKICLGKISLSQHECRCKENPNRKQSAFIRFNKKHNKAWNKGLTKETDKRVKAGAKTLKESYATGKIENHNKGKKCSNEQKEKTRISTLKYLEKTKGPIRQRYSINACKYIDELNKKIGWKLQHAENGGEVSVAGYFLDGYDKELNIAFEYDEPAHYIDVENNILREKDVERQNYIIEKLNCKFYRYNEKLDKFYEIN